MNLIEKLVQERKAKNITQKELAERTGIDQANISKIETGLRSPTLNVLEKLANGLNMNVKLESKEASKR